MSLLDSQASQMVMIHCAACNVPFAIYSVHDRRLRESHENFYCPNGHSNVYRGKTELDKVREQRDAAQHNADRMRHELEKLRQEQRLKKCPHCAKRFINLTTHIKRAHGK